MDVHFGSRVGESIFDGNFLWISLTILYPQNVSGDSNLCILPKDNIGSYCEFIKQECNPKYFMVARYYYCWSKNSSVSSEVRNIRGNSTIPKCDPPLP